MLIELLVTCVLALTLFGCNRGTEPETVRATKPNPEVTFTLDDASQKAMDRLYPRGEGTAWCFVERTCPEGKPGTGSWIYIMHYRSIQDAQNAADGINLCLDLIPCSEVNLFPKVAPTDAELTR